MLSKKLCRLSVGLLVLFSVGIAAAQSVRLARIGLGDSKADITRELGPGCRFKIIRVTNVPNLEYLMAENDSSREVYTIDVFEDHVFGFAYHKNFDHPALISSLVESITSKTWPLSGQGPSNSYVWQTDGSGNPVKGNPCWTDYWRAAQANQGGNMPVIKPYPATCGVFVTMWDAVNKETTQGTDVDVLDEKVMNKVVVAARNGAQQQHDQQIKQAQKQGSPF
jgi:hypothetical protein